MSKVETRGKGRPDMFAYSKVGASAREKAIVAVMKKYGIKQGKVQLETVGIEYQAAVGSTERKQEKPVISAPTLGKLCKGHAVALTRGRPTFEHLASLGLAPQETQAEAVPEVVAETPAVAEAVTDSPAVEAMESEGAPVVAQDVA